MGHGHASRRMHRVGRGRKTVSHTHRSTRISYHDLQRRMALLQAHSQVDPKLLSLEAIVKSSSALGEVYTILKTRLRGILSRARTSPQGKIKAVSQGNVAGACMLNENLAD